MARASGATLVGGGVGLPPRKNWRGAPDRGPVLPTVGGRRVCHRSTAGGAGVVEPRPRGCLARLADEPSLTGERTALAGSRRPAGGDGATSSAADARSKAWRARGLRRRGEGAHVAPFPDWGQSVSPPTVLLRIRSSRHRVARGVRRRPRPDRGADRGDRGGDTAAGARTGPRPPGSSWTCFRGRITVRRGELGAGVRPPGRRDRKPDRRRLADHHRSKSGYEIPESPPRIRITTAARRTSSTPPMNATPISQTHEVDRSGAHAPHYTSESRPPRDGGGSSSPPMFPTRNAYSLLA